MQCRSIRRSGQPTRATASSNASPTSPLRHPSQTQTLIDALASGKEGRIVAWYGGAQSTNGETRIKGKGRPRSGFRLIQRAKPRQRGGEPELRERNISIGLNATP